MDFLYEHAAELEKHVFFETANLFNLKVDLIFYDTTTAGFFIDREDDDAQGGLRKFCPAKEGFWAPSVVVALLMERLAEISCGQSWHRIRQGLEALQIFYFSTAEHGFYRTNELTGNVRNLLKSLKISPPKPIQGIRKRAENV
ncbi:MAG: hypothetical protein JRJ83_13945 [Deltaproteobacteria bacterium]|nr:hypothetical protein [Deltaproteobacteria bacterium]